MKNQKCSAHSYNLSIVSIQEEAYILTTNKK